MNVLSNQSRQTLVEKFCFFPDYFPKSNIYFIYNCILKTPCKHSYCNTVYSKAQKKTPELSMPVIFTLEAQSLD